MGALPELRKLTLLQALRGLCLFSGVVCGFGPAMAQDAACTGDLTLTGAGPDQVDLHFVLPCEPYAAVAVGYGPIRFVEETGLSGQLTLSLPRLAGVDAVVVTAAEHVFHAAVPEGGNSAAYVALDWGLTLGPVALSANGATAHAFGFPGGMPQALVLPVKDAGPVQIDLPVTENTCGQNVTFRLHQMSRTQPVTIELPPCDRSGQTLRLTLEPPAG